MKYLIGFVLYVILMQPFVTLADDLSALEPITPENAQHLVQVARYGEGVFTGAIAWSPDSTRLAFGGSLGVWIYSTTASDSEPEFIDYDRWVYALAWSPDGETLAITQDDGVHFYDLISKEDRIVVSGSGAIAFSPDGKLLAVGEKIPASDDYQEWRLVAGLHVYDARTGERIASRRTDYQDSNAVKVQFSHDNILLAVTYSVEGNAVSCTDEVFQYLDVYTVENFLVSPESVPVLATQVVNKGMGWNGLLDNPIASGDRFYGEGSGNIVLHGLTNDMKQTTLGEIENWLVDDLALHPDGEFLIATGRDPETYPLGYTTVAFDLQTGEKLFTLAESSFSSPSFSADGNWLAGFRDESWIIWEVHNHQLEEKNSFSLASADWSVDDGRLQLPDQDVLLAINQTEYSRSDDTEIWLSPNEKSMVAGGIQAFALVDTTSAKSEIIYENEQLGSLEFIGDFVFSSDNHWLAFDVGGWCGCGCGSYNTVYLWNLGSNFEDATLSKEFSTAEVTQLNFSADSRLLVAALYSDIRIWDIATGEQLTVLDGHTYDHVLATRFYTLNVHDAVFSQDGTRLFSYSTDGTIRVWAVDENSKAG